MKLTRKIGLWLMLCTLNQFFVLLQAADALGQEERKAFDQAHKALAKARKLGVDPKRVKQIKATLQSVQKAWEKVFQCVQNAGLHGSPLAHVAKQLAQQVQRVGGILRVSQRPDPLENEEINAGIVEAETMLKQGKSANAVKTLRALSDRIKDQLIDAQIAYDKRQQVPGDPDQKSEDLADLKDTLDKLLLSKIEINIRMQQAKLYDTAAVNPLKTESSHKTVFYDLFAQMVPLVNKFTTALQLGTLSFESGATLARSLEELVRALKPVISPASTGDGQQRTYFVVTRSADFLAKQKAFHLVINKIQEQLKVVDQLGLQPYDASQLESLVNEAVQQFEAVEQLMLQSQEQTADAVDLAQLLSTFTQYQTAQQTVIDFVQEVTNRIDPLTQKLAFSADDLKQILSIDLKKGTALTLQKQDPLLIGIGMLGRDEQFKRTLGYQLLTQSSSEKIGFDDAISCYDPIKQMQKATDALEVLRLYHANFEVTFTPAQKAQQFDVVYDALKKLDNLGKLLKQAEQLGDAALRHLSWQSFTTWTAGELMALGGIRAGAYYSSEDYIRMRIAQDFTLAAVTPALFDLLAGKALKIPDKDFMSAVASLCQGVSGLAVAMSTLSIEQTDALFDIEQRLIQTQARIEQLVAPEPAQDDSE